MLVNGAAVGSDPDPVHWLNPLPEDEQAHLLNEPMVQKVLNQVDAMMDEMQQPYAQLLKLVAAAIVIAVAIVIAAVAVVTVLVALVAVLVAVLIVALAVYDQIQGDQDVSQNQVLKKGWTIVYRKVRLLWYEQMGTSCQVKQGVGVGMVDPY